MKKFSAIFAAAAFMAGLLLSGCEVMGAVLDGANAGLNGGSSSSSSSYDYSSDSSPSYSSSSSSLSSSSALTVTYSITVYVSYTYLNEDSNRVSGSCYYTTEQKATSGAGKESECRNTASAHALWMAKEEAQKSALSQGAFINPGVEVVSSEVTSCLEISRNYYEY